MRLHLCSLNWSKWSTVIQGYTYKVQVRACSVCGKVTHRTVGYVEGASTDSINENLK